jgi:NNP family nitrate/nitrite transporter-like MFS transporter
MAFKAGPVTEVTPSRIVAGGVAYALRPPPASETRSLASSDPDVLVWPTGTSWHEPVVRVGDVVKKKQLLARGTTHVYFQANVWIFTAIVFAVGIAMGVGKAAVYKHIPEYFPGSVGVVGGIVGVIGGLGGFACPILFGSLLERTGIWTTCWAFFLVLSLACLVWMHLVVRRIVRSHAPAIAERIESAPAPAPAFRTPPPARSPAPQGTP